MTIRELEIFVEVVKTRNMSDAANNLYISQPTVSHSITQIEKEFNVKLFERISKKLYITKTGRELYKYATQITSMYNDAVMFLQHQRNSLSLNIGASITIGSIFLTEVINKFDIEHSGIDTKIIIDNTEDIVAKVVDGSIDIGFVEGDVDRSDLIIEDFFEDELVLICDNNSKFKNIDSISINDLTDEVFALADEGNGIRDFFINVLRSKHININVKWICHSLESILSIVERGAANSVGSKKFAEGKHLNMVRMRDMDHNPTFKIVYHRDKYISPEIKDIINNMKVSFKK